MRKIIVLSGISGCGKTRRRTTEAGLKNLPCVDIADIYAEKGSIDSALAFHILCERINRLLDNHNQVVVELYASIGRRYALEGLADRRLAQIQFLDMPEDISTCIVRVEEQMYDEQTNGLLTPDRERIHQARLRWLRDLRQQEIAACGSRVYQRR